MVIKSGRLPAPGETVLGGNFFMNPGGKGANQAVAAARLGGMVSFVTRVGQDIFGKGAKELMGAEGIDTRCVYTDPVLPSGVALITIDQHGENTIVVAPGANASLSPSDIDQSASVIHEAEVLLLQLEISLDTVAHAIGIASRSGAKIMLNPAPAHSIPPDLLEKIHILTPNRKEAEWLTGIPIVEGDFESARRAASALHEKGVATVVITLGRDGALLYRGKEFIQVAAPVVKPVDTTAAGDVFNGAMAVAIATGAPLKEAVHFACRAAAISVTRLGAQSSAPYHHEID
jgi:ribokinase